MFYIGKICDHVIHVQVIIIHHLSLVVLKHKIWILLDGNLPWSPLPAPTFLQLKKGNWYAFVSTAQSYSSA